MDIIAPRILNLELFCAGTGALRSMLKTNSKKAWRTRLIDERTYLLKCIRKGGFDCINVAVAVHGCDEAKDKAVSCDNTESCTKGHAWEQ